ncbi:MAG: SPOR domain-containing protein [Elusimicrobia bacterium]|nr:SPOR domain-containing protein [Elusimicrobiota bacterium]
MASQNKSLWVVLALVAVGMVILFLSFKASSKKVVQDVMAQKDTVPSPAIVTSPENGKEAGFAVQVYSFKGQKRANLALDSLKSKGFAETYIEISNLGERGTWYRVRIGGLKDEALARTKLETIRKDFNRAWLVKPSRTK